MNQVQTNPNSQMPSGTPFPKAAGSNGSQTTDVPQQPTVKNPNSTQNALMFEELRDDMVVMGDGTYRAVVAAQSVNFDLMSDREREGVEYSYQQFLNSLTFPIQIYIRSQRVDIGPYLEKLDQLRINQDNMLLGVLMDDYIGFIDSLSQEANIMDKSFFIVIPYAYGDENAAKAGDRSDTTKGLLGSLFAPQNRHMHIKVPANQYDHAMEELAKRCSAVIDGLSEVGVKALRLKTKELSELYYNVYNPDTAVREPIGDFRNYTVPIIRKASDAERSADGAGGQL